MPCTHAQKATIGVWQSQRWLDLSLWPVKALEGYGNGVARGSDGRVFLHSTQPLILLYSCRYDYGHHRSGRPSGDLAHTSHTVIALLESQKSPTCDLPTQRAAPVKDPSQEASDSGFRFAPRNESASIAFASLTSDAMQLRYRTSLLGPLGPLASLGNGGNRFLWGACACCGSTAGLLPSGFGGAPGARYCAGNERERQDGVVA